MSVAASDRFEAARSTVARWFRVADDQVVFTHGTTDAINLVRRGLPGLRRVVFSIAEHHSNLLPWRAGLDWTALDCDAQGRVDPAALDAELAKAPADLVAIAHVGNVLGTIQPIAELAEVAHRHGALMLVDAAQSASHLPVGPDDLGADFVACSGHKMLGPSGVGALVGKYEALERLRPVDWGGSMVQSVDAAQCQLQPLPRMLEAGTPPIESVFGWAAALEYLESLGLATIREHLESLTTIALERLAQIPGLKILGPSRADERAGIITLQLVNWEAHALARVLSQRGNVCVRSGFHCAEPLHQHLGLPPTLRASFHVYTSRDDVDRLVEVLESIANLALS
jgi:cysteine desulfurase/selenocysteine lyase